MLSGKAGEAYQAFRTVSTWIVQPGELWDRQLGALTDAQRDQMRQQMTMLTSPLAIAGIAFVTQAAGLFVGWAIGAAILKYGVPTRLEGEPVLDPMNYVRGTFGWGGVVGGFIFGLGAMFAGGCGSGCSGSGFGVGSGSVSGSGSGPTCVAMRP